MLWSLRVIRLRGGVIVVIAVGRAQRCGGDGGATLCAVQRDLIHFTGAVAFGVARLRPHRHDGGTRVAAPTTELHAPRARDRASARGQGGLLEPFGVVARAWEERVQGGARRDHRGHR